MVLDVDPVGLGGIDGRVVGGGGSRSGVVVGIVVDGQIRADI